MEAAGDLIAGVFPAKFAAGVEHGHDHLERGELALLVRIYRDAAAVIHDAHAIARQE